MNEPLVSIVVISYNQAKYIKENLDSLKAQTYPNWELIVADDASPDHSVEEFKNWLKENNVNAKKLFHTKNTGLATVLNEAVELCEGEYIKIIAADDFLHPEIIEKSVKSLEEKGDEYGMVFTDTFAINNHSDIVEDIADYNFLGNTDPRIFKKELLKGNRIAALTVLMRTKVLKETGKYDSTFIIEDYYRWLKISAKYLIAYIPEKLAYYRIHSQNISKIKEKKIEMEAIHLQMIFDKEGFARKNINKYILTSYISGQKFTKDFIHAYQDYPFYIKRLYFAIKFNLPIPIYKFLNKFV